ncbi:MAG: AraC family transcriptional regulator [Moraxellaceae bacterium]
MSVTPGVALHYVSEAIRLSGLEPARVIAVLEAAGLDPALLQKPELRISTQQYSDISIALMRLINDEFFLIGGRRRTPFGSFALMCQSIIHLPTLRGSLRRGLRFYELFAGDIHFRLRHQDDRVEVSVRWDEPSMDALHTSTESMLTIIHRLSSWLIDQRIPLIEATFAYAPPAHVEDYHRLFHCPLRFNQPRNSLVFSSAYLNYPLMQNEASLKAFLRESPNSLFVPPTNAQLLTAQIRAMLGQDFTREFPEFEEVADDLGLTPQTLRRRLKEENSSYQGIKDQVRRDAAIYYLSRPQLGIAEIAHLMGFSEPSTFHRAFKKWTGLTPGEYRQGLQH